MSLKFESEIIPAVKLNMNMGKKRLSRNVMTKYEAAAVIGKRAAILARGQVKTSLKMDAKDKSNYPKIAELELYQHLIPFTIRRWLEIKGKKVAEDFNIYDHPTNSEIRCELTILKI